jgi:hypothetical protein
MATKATIRLLTSTSTGFGVTAVPVIGWFWAGWAAETAMILYLLETLLAVPLIVLRIQLLRPPVDQLDPSELRKRREWIQTYLVVVAGFGGGCTIFMAAFLFLFMRFPLDLADLRTGLIPICIFLLVGFIADLILRQPLGLSEVEGHLEKSLGRVFLLFLAVFVGVWLAAIEMIWFLIPFVVLKTLADLEQPLNWLGDRFQQLYTLLRKGNTPLLG